MKIIQYVLAVVFILSGAAKLLSLPFELAAFERWGYPLAFMYFIGVAEVSGGVALVANILKKWAALGLSLLMLGAVFTHVMHQEWPMLVAALLILFGSMVLTLNGWKREQAPNHIEH